MAMPAEARRVTVDSPWPMPEAGMCVLDPGIVTEGCVSVPLGFQVHINGRSYSSVYLYDDGLVSFGKKIPRTGNSNFPDYYGSNVIVAGFSPIVLDPYTNELPLNFARFGSRGSGDPSIGVGSYIYLDWYVGKVVTSGGYIDPDNPDAGLLPGTTAWVEEDYLLATLFLEALPVRGTARAAFSVMLDPAPDVEVGYLFPNFGGSTWYASYAEFEIGSRAPEPGSWALLIAGFGMVGAAVRRRAPARA
jgi:hypothetical protein